MSKRKLNRRQTSRIEKIQNKRILRAGKCDTIIDDGQYLEAEQEGLVVAHFGTQVEVESKDQPGKRRRCHFRSNLGSLVTGDRVIWRDGDPTGVVVAVEQRQSELSRPDPFGEIKTIAANIDRILIVISPLPKPQTKLVDRYLVAAETLGIEPILVVNKMDLIDSDHETLIRSFCDLYQSLSYTIVRVSAREKKGLDVVLIKLLKSHTGIFVGQSGVGKSSLINALVPDLNLQIGKLSQSNHKGTHTTTTAQLVHLPEGGHLIDSPGVNEFGLQNMESEEILYGFVELRDFIGRCRFRDCRHQQEPDCAIRRAHRDGHISDRRFESYLALREQGRGM